MIFVCMDVTDAGEWIGTAISSRQLFYVVVVLIGMIILAFCCRSAKRRPRLRSRDKMGDKQKT